MASCKSALSPSPTPHPPPPPPVVYSTDRSKAVVPALVLLFGALWFIVRGDLLYALPCVIMFLCFSVLLALRLPRLGKREVILVLFVCLFDLCLFGFCRFSLPLDVWEGLRFVIVALSGLFSYLFFMMSLSEEKQSEVIETSSSTSKKTVREKSRECHNHKPQPFQDPKRKRKPTNLNKHKPNKRTKSTKTSSPPPFAHPPPPPARQSQY